MTNKTKSALIAAVVAIGIASPALAQAPGERYGTARQHQFYDSYGTPSNYSGEFGTSTTGQNYGH